MTICPGSLSAASHGSAEGIDARGFHGACVVGPRPSLPCAELCATAVAHKLAQALLDAGPDARGGGANARQELLRERLEEDLDLVALATIADVVPLLGENRE